MAHQPLIESLTEFYNTLAALRYIPTFAIVHPPKGGHKDVDEAAAREQGFSDEMISLMKSLPYLAAECEDVSVAPATKPRSYLEDDFLDWARDPTFTGSHMTKAIHLVLTNPGQYGTVLIYDSEQSNCVSWSPSKGIQKPCGDQQALEGLAYAHLPFLPAEQVIRQWTQKWISLQWLPLNETNGWHLLIEEPSEAELRQASKTSQLREQCQVRLLQRELKNCFIAAGWDATAPDLESARRNFDGEAYEHKKLQWKESTQALLDQAFSEKWPWARISARANLLSERAAILDQGPDDGPKTRLRI